ncbi:hypothetical protein [Chryseobacterium turcicum]|uniref:Uncharacterized protein n=1 Tax=Chryseobacterium turcicum TaxID=2898076 RepID=A0A9Q3V6J6_9FLAO|nr:hypothetical protein [Chryseobacterium turcicum]MCD1118099.1 hypothetical protein [Chryseobacterium turcicum]
METTLVYFILITSLSLPLLQVYVSMNYFKQFAFEYLDNKQSSWNSNFDRSALFFSACFGLFSFYLAKLLWHGDTDNSWFLTTVYTVLIILFCSFSIYYLMYVASIKKSMVSNIKIDEKLYKDIDDNSNSKFFNYLIETKKINSDTKKDDFQFIYSDLKNKTKIIWTGKVNGKFTYVTLILFFKVILKDEHFTKKNVKNEMEKKFLFEKKDSNTGDTYIGQLDQRSFENAFDNINFDDLLLYQQSEFDIYSSFINKSL